MTSRHTAFALIVTAAVGCGAPASIDGYVPFDAATVAGARAELDVISAFKDTLEAKDFAAIEVAYARDIQSRLRALAATHAWIADGANLGARLDADALAQIAAGQQATETVQREAAEEAMQTIMLGYLDERLFASLQRGDKAGWDTAFALAGRSVAGAPTGLATLVADRDTEFGVRNADRVLQAFIDGRTALAGGQSPATASATLDATLHTVFALSMRHEFAEAADAVATGAPLDAVEGFAVGRGLWRWEHDYAVTLGAGGAASVDAELAKGDPADPSSMTSVSFPTMVTAVESLFGLRF